MYRKPKGGGPVRGGCGRHLKACGKEPSCHQLNQSRRPRQLLPGSPKRTGRLTQSRPLAAQIRLGSKTRSPVPAQKCPQSCQTRFTTRRGGGRQRAHGPSGLESAVRTNRSSEARAEPEARPERRARDEAARRVQPRGSRGSAAAGRGPAGRGRQAGARRAGAHEAWPGARRAAWGRGPAEAPALRK